MILNGPGISYTEPDIGAEFVPPLPEHPREAIVKLCEHCTNRLLHRDELLGYEYWSFAEAATDEQAEVLCKMKMRRPYTLPEMVKLTGMPEADGSARVQLGKPRARQAVGAAHAGAGFRRVPQHAREPARGASGLCQVL